MEVFERRGSISEVSVFIESVFLSAIRKVFRKRTFWPLS